MSLQYRPKIPQGPRLTIKRAENRSSKRGLRNLLCTSINFVKPFLKVLNEFRRPILFVFILVCFSVFVASVVLPAYWASKNPNDLQSDLQIDVVILTLVILLSATFLWFIFYSVVNRAVRKPKVAANTPAVQTFWHYLWQLEHLWLWILIVGLMGTLFSFIAETDYKEIANRPDYIALFLEKRGLTVFSVVMASLLADFVITMMYKLIDARKTVEDAGGILKTASDSIETSKKEMKKVNERFDSAREGVNDATTSLSGATKCLADTENNVKTAIANLANNQSQLTDNAIPALQGVLREIRICSGRLEEERRLLTTIGRLSDNNYMRRMIEDIYSHKMDDMKYRVAKIFTKYIDNESSYLPVLLASTFVDQFVKQFGGQSGAGSIEGEVGYEERFNFIQANYAIMSQIVDNLYRQSDALYQEYGALYEKLNKELKQVVYFTTLPLPIKNYLNPKDFAGPIPSIIRQWDNVRRRTRKAVYGYGEKDKYLTKGHMWRFLEDRNRFVFKRCCLWLGEEEEKKRGDNSADGILHFEEWKRRSSGPNSCDTYEIDIPEISKVGDFIVPGRMDGGYSIKGKSYNWILAPLNEHPGYLDCLYDGDVDEGLIKSVKKDALEVFKRLYHPTDNDCMALEMTYGELGEMYRESKANKRILDNAFDDAPWARLVASLEGDNNPIIKLEKGGSNVEYCWHEIFYNRHIPVDIFAIGTLPNIEAPASHTLIWWVCLGGYVGGDFNSMYLSWHDSIIDSESEKQYDWSAIQVYLNHLYRRAKRLDQMMSRTEGR